MNYIEMGPIALTFTILAIILVIAMSYINGEATNFPHASISNRSTTIFWFFMISALVGIYLIGYLIK